MRAILEVRFLETRPPKSGYYLTNLGELYWNEKETQFQLDKETKVDLNIGIASWYKVVELYTQQDLGRKYDQGYTDGISASNPSELFHKQ